MIEDAAREHTLFVALGLALYGRDWQQPMADALAVNSRRVRYWAAGQPIPPGIWSELRSLARDHQDTIGDLIDDLPQQGRAMKFTITVTETVIEDYDPIVIEAETEEEAQAIAEEWRVNGWLGHNKFIQIEDVDFDVSEASPDAVVSEQKLALGSAA